MKKISFFFLGWLGLFASAPAQPSRTIRITGTRLAYPIFQKWADEYTKLHPGVKFQVSKAPADSADLLIVSYTLRPADVKEGQTVIALTRYAQLPVVSSRRPDVAALQAKGFDDSAFRQVYFSGRQESIPSLYTFTVYKRQQPACASIAFANHFGSEQQDIKGKGVTGDDRDLLAAVKRDPSGISYNNLGFLYDLATRKPVDSIAIIPIDLNENGRTDADENIYASLDEVLGFIERTHHPRIPLENVNVLIRKNNPDGEVTAFLQWVLSTGQQYNHAYGFINLDGSVARSEVQALAVLNKK
jgi:phosphate transport system substrate-binding protein